MPAGAGAHGYKALTFNAPGTDYQVHKDIKKYVHDKGQASGDGSHFGTVLYNRGLFQAMVQVEAARVAQKFMEHLKLHQQCIVMEWKMLI